MWLWLQNSNSFFKKVIIYSLLIHLIVLSYLLFVVQDKSLNLDIFLNKDLLNNSPVPIVLLPFAKTVPGSLQQLKKLSQASPKATPGAAKKSATKISGNKKVIIIEKVSKKKVTRASKKFEPQIKSAKKKAVKQETKPEVKQQEIKQEIKEEKPVDVSVEALAKTEACDQPIAIYLGAKDMQGCMLVSGIQLEILKYWKPPVGLPRGIECKVNIKVRADGKVESLKIEKPSKILAYDISLRNAILKSIMPNELKGKEFTLTLNS